MPVREAAYRLKVDGQAESKRAWGAEKAAGVDAATGISAAFDETASKAEASAQRQVEAWRRMGRAAIDEQQRLANNAKFDAMLGVGGGAGKSARDSASVFEEKFAGGISRQARAGRLNLVRQGADVFTTAAMGMNPGMIAIQQGPQILDALATSGFKLTPALIGVGAAVTAAAGAIGALAVAANQADAAQTKLEVASRGLGAAAGLSARQLESLAENNARAGEVSVGAARDMAAAYVSTGRIGEATIGGLIGITRRWALYTQQDAQGASAELARAFADPAKGAEELNTKLHFLSASQQRHIELMARAGDTAGAQAAMMAQLNARLGDSAVATTNLASAWDAVARASANAWDWLGRAIYRSLAGDAAKSLEELRDTRRRVETEMLDGAVKSRRLDEINSQIQARRRELAATSSDRANDKSVAVQTLVDRYNPNAARLAELRADRTNLINSGRNDPEAKKAIGELDDQIKALAAGYKTASAQATALGKAQREAAKEARAAAKEAKENGVETARGIAIGFDLTNAAMEREATLRDMAMDQERKLAAIRGDSLYSYDQQVAFEARLAEYRRAGVDWQEAYNRTLAETVALTEAETNARANPKKFVSAQDQMAKVANIDLDEGRLRAKIDTLRQPFGDAAAAGLYAAGHGGKFRDSIRDSVKEGFLKAISDRTVKFAVDALFGATDASGKSSGGLLASIFGGAKKSILPGDQPAVSFPNPLGGTKGGVGSFLTSLFFKSVGKNANGTENWPGGWSWLGEDGPELGYMPPGSKVFSNAKSMAMAAPQAPTPVTFDLRGAVMTEDLLRQMQEMANGAQSGAVNQVMPQIGPKSADYLQRTRQLRTA